MKVCAKGVAKAVFLTLDAYAHGRGLADECETKGRPIATKAKLTRSARFGEPWGARPYAPPLQEELG